MQARAVAHPNIALIKYWGKRDTTLNLPAVGSISITLDQLAAQTRVSFDQALDDDELILNGQPQPAALPRISRCLDACRALAGTDRRARITSENNFPTAAGLASSAAGYAALVTAASAALDLELDKPALSGLARQGSGSAARSLFGGFVEWHRGERDDGSDSLAEALLDGADWPLEVVIGITSEEAKSTGSTEGMELSRLTSPYYAAWLDGQEQDLAAARQAIQQQDFEQLAELAEFSCLKMHAVAMSSQPGLIYWNGATVAAMQQVRELRQAGTPVFFTIDAGPQIKAVCEAGASVQVEQALAEVPGVQRTIHCGLGESARLIED